MEKRNYIIRKRYLLKKGFQLRFTLVIIGAMILIALVTGFSIYSAVTQTLVTQFHGENLALIKHAITYKLLMRSILLIIAIAIISIFISHRIAGPVYKFEQTLRALAQEKEVQEIRLRKHDEFYDLAMAINNLIKLMKH
jgi:signal transduction histidine kinase